MKITRKKLGLLIREAILTEAPSDAPSIDTLAQEIVNAINLELPSAFDNPPAASVGRTKVGDSGGIRYATQQNIDVLIYGPYLHDLIGQINNGKNPGWYFFRPGLYRNVPDSPFWLYQEAAQTYISLFAAVDEKIDRNTAQTITKNIWRKISQNEPGTPEYEAYMETEDYWDKGAGDHRAAGIGTHESGGAFDLQGYHEGSSQNHIDAILDIIQRFAEQNGLQLSSQTNAEVDHIHVSFEPGEN